MPELDHIRFSIVPSEELTAAQHRDIDSLAVHSLQRDFPERPPAEIAYLAAASSKHRHDPNGAVGGSHLAAGQRYARSVSVIAVDTQSGRLLAQAPFADNASSDFSRNTTNPIKQLAGAGEIWAKLHVPTEKLVGARYRWAGLCVLSKDARAMLADASSEEGTIIDGLLLGGLRDALDHQPFKAYPYRGEKLWGRYLRLAGLTHNPDLDWGDVYAFGPTAPPVYQETLQSATVYTTRQRLIAKKGIEKVLTQVKRTRS